jgi:hypothetical protein
MELSFRQHYASASERPRSLGQANGTVILSLGPNAYEVSIADIKKLEFNDDALWSVLRHGRHFTIDRCHFCDEAERRQFIEGQNKGTSLIFARVSVMSPFPFPVSIVTFLRAR